MSEKWQKLEIIQIPAQWLEFYVKVPGRHHVTARKEVNIVVMDAIIDRILLMRMGFLLKGIGKECTGDG